MLRIRFSRTGKVGQPSYRVVVAENRSPVKGRYLEMLGNYMPARKPKVVAIRQDRVTYWISKGAIPTDSVAALLKKEGMAEMDKYLEPRNKQRKPKGEEEAKPKPATVGEPKATEAAAAPAK
ncbi:30S ribosomal protein S16 [Candidatus Peregrinibacteria bacterium]|nr:30S ribosomal protein S16 [Candidatus Peregrinibacteria bacterium]